MSLEFAPGTRGFRAAVCLVLFAATAAAYQGTLAHGFVPYDDDIYIAQNPHLGRGSLAWTLAPYEANWIPLTYLSFEADYAAGGLDPAVYHRTNLTLHALATLLLFLALASLTRSDWRSAAVAGVFALHPLHVESVAWVAERKDVLSGVFFALALWAWSGYARRGSRAERAR